MSCKVLKPTLRSSELCITLMRLGILYPDLGTCCQHLSRGAHVAVRCLQRLRSLERLESLDIAYVNVGTYSMRLHIVRLTELLYLPRLRRLRLLVPGLHDAADAAAFLGANFMRQLREGCLQRLDITLLSEDNGKSLLDLHCDPIVYPLHLPTAQCGGWTPPCSQTTAPHTYICVCMTDMYMQCDMHVHRSLADSAVP